MEKNEKNVLYRNLEQKHFKNASTNNTLVLLFYNLLTRWNKTKNLFKI